MRVYAAAREPYLSTTMKLATYKDGSRDGQLVVVSRDLGLAHYASGIAGRLQQVLDDWNFLSPQLEDLYLTLNQGRARHAFSFEPRQCMAPLPRAFQWAHAAAWPNHAVLRARAAGVALTDDEAIDPPLVQAAGDGFLGPNDVAWFGSDRWGIDFEAGLAVITGDVDSGASESQALDGVRLLVLANAWRLRELPAGEGTPGASPLQTRPATAFGPVAVTPDELGPAWKAGRVQLKLQVRLNGHQIGLCETGPEMALHFGQLIARLGRTRPVRAGSLVGALPVSNDDAARGSCCIADRRAREWLARGEAATGYLVAGDTVRVELTGSNGQSVFGAVEQTVAAPRSSVGGAGETADAGDAAGPPAGAADDLPD